MKFIPANTIQQVVEQLDIIIANSISENSRLGYFAILYREVTLGVQTAIQQGFFEDGQRMEQLDVVFANRYLKAFYQYNNQEAATLSWIRTFECRQRTELTVIQHLLLGMNAHINLDLGIAAAEISNSQNIQSLKRDFDKINIVIGNVYNSLIPRLKKVAWAVMMLGDINPSFTNQVINFSINKARDQAWNNAILLVESGAGKPSVIQTTDTIIASVAQKISSPKFSTSVALKIIRLFESNNVAKNLKILKG